MTGEWTRRTFLKTTVGAVAMAPMSNAWLSAQPAPLFKISMAQWSLHRTLRAKEIDHLDFARVAKRDFGIEAIEYVN